MGGHTIHRLPNTRDPKWLTFLNSAPRQKTIMGAIGLTFVISGFCCVLTMSQGTHVHTLKDDWVQANKEYMVFQNMNPIFGISSVKKH